MKEFEKFEKTLDCPATGSLPCSVAENTWRAALEWAKSDPSEYLGSGFDFDYINIDKIDEELNS